MIISGVTKEDLRLLAQLINTVQAGEYAVNGKDLCAAADAIRFLQDMAVKASKAYTENVAPESPAVVGASAPAAPAPSSGFGEGVTVKSFSPGKPGRKK